MIITLCGSNGYGVRRALDVLVEDYVTKHGRHGLERLDGEEFDPNRLPDLLQSGSLFASERLVVLRSATKNKSLWEALGEKVQQVPAETTVVLVEGELDKRTRTYKQLKAHSDFREHGELSEPELLRWLQSEVKQLGGEIDRPIANYLLTQVGSDQWRLSHELQKLVQYSPDITKRSIDELVEPSPQASAFELLDVALARQPAKTRDLIAILKFSEDPYKLFGLLVSQVHILALIAAAGNRNADEIVKSTGLHPFVVRKMSGPARSISRPQLKRMISDIADCDWQLKSSGADPWLLLEQVLNKIALR